MLTLDKAKSATSISLDKADPAIRIKAVWIDNGDDKDNDDLDLRAGVLLPDGSVHFLDCERPGSINEFPYICHQGDVQTASVDEPGSEVILMNKDISKLVGGDVSVVFSVYSAVANGAVSIASLQPKMEIEFGHESVRCAVSYGSTGSMVYTYVLGVVTVKGNDVSITPCGLTSSMGSEKTPWPTWEKGEAKVEFIGPPVIKGRNNAVGNTEPGLFSKLFGNGKPKLTYVNIG